MSYKNVKFLCYYDYMKGEKKVKNKKNIIIGSALVSIFLIAGLYFYTKVYSEKINVVSYKEPAQINESGYQITKYENLDAYDWIDDDNVLVLKENGNYDSDSGMAYVSIYNLDTKKRGII